jgi:NADH-quinone oxidoreductase subunit M
LATFGVVLGAAYMLWLTKRVIFGNTNNNEIKNLKDINNLEALMLNYFSYISYSYLVFTHLH